MKLIKVSWIYFAGGEHRLPILDVDLKFWSTESSN